MSEETTGRSTLVECFSRNWLAKLGIGLLLLLIGWVFVFPWIDRVLEAADRTH